MMRKARLAIRKVNVALDSPGYYLVPVAFDCGNLERAKATKDLSNLRRLICSLSASSLAKEDQVNDSAYQYYGHDNQLLQVFRIKGLRWNCPQCGSTMTAMMIDD